MPTTPIHGWTTPAGSVAAGKADEHMASLADQIETTLTGTYLALTGGTLTGDLTLPGDPDAALKAATKQYVDDAAGGVIAADGSTVQVVNTTTETTLLSHTIPANTFGNDDVMRLVAWGDYLENAAAGTTRNIRVKLGGTTLFSGAVVWTAATSANRGSWRMQCELHVEAAASFNRMVGELIATDTGTSGGTWVDTTVGASQWLASATPNKDFTASLALAVTAQMSAASANSDVRLLGWYLERVNN